MSKLKKLTTIILSTIISFSLVLNNISTLHANENPTSNIEEEETDFQYILVKDDAQERIITYNEDESTVKITYDKNSNTLIVERTINDTTTIEIITPQSAIMTRGSSMFSPWKYSKSGNKYKLTAVINGKTVSKTRTRTKANGGYIDRFCDAIDNIQSEEWNILKTLIIHSAGEFALTSGKTITKLYARAKSAYKHCKKEYSYD